MIRILIADDHKLFRETLGASLAANANVEVIALCAGSDEALAQINAQAPDIVLMDINIAPLSGLEATKKITASSPARVIGLSMHSHPSYARNMIRAGAKGYITKNSSIAEIITAVKEVQEGKRFICAEIKNMMADSQLTDKAEQPTAAALTDREIEIVNLLKQGLSSKEIACTISTALKTVEVHRHNILKKLKLKNASSLVNFAHTNADFFA